MGEVTAGGTLDRRAVVRRLLVDRGDLLVVTGLGSPSYDAMAAGDHDANYYLWAAMGSAATVGLGLAKARPDRPVLVLTGDGEMLMGLGALATIALQKPANLTIAVLDNGHYGETGMQPSHAGRGVELAEVARACGFASAETIRDMDGVAALQARLAAKDGPRFATVKISAENPPRVLPPRDGVHVKNRFRAAMGLQPL
ncbi:MAG: aldehyde dehydrogenase [Alphaproteobacteria bacterium]|nr:aldehyde dehydrogenase [Alphaproteobacteria bacterium]